MQEKKRRSLEGPNSAKLSECNGERAAGVGEDRSLSAEHDDVDVFLLLETLWRQRLLIVGVVLIAITLAAAYVFTTTPLYRITMQVRPGITGYNGEIPIRSWKVSDIKAWFDNEQYLAFLGTLNLNGEKLPRITVGLQGNQDTVSISLLTANPQTGKQILSTILKEWISYNVAEGNNPEIRLNLANLQREIESKRAGLEVVEEIKTKQLELKKGEYNRQIEKQQKNIELITQQRQTNERALEQLQEQIDFTIKNTAELVNLRNAMLNAKQAQNLSMLLYTNIIQQNIYYVNNLQERESKIAKEIIDSKKAELETMGAIELIKQNIRETDLGLMQLALEQKSALQLQIAQLEKRAQAIAPLELVSEPLAGKDPVRPKKTLTLVMAAALGFFIGISLAFIRTALQSRRTCKAR